MEEWARSLHLVNLLFDVTWKANVRNIALLEKNLHITPKNRKSDRLFLIGLTLFLAIIVLGFATLTVMLIRYLWNAFS